MTIPFYISVFIFFLEPKKSLRDDDDDESDDSMWDTSDDDDSDSSFDEGDGAIDWRSKFLKKPEAEEKEKKTKVKSKKGTGAGYQAKDTEEDGDWTKVERTLDKPKMFEKDAEITHDLVIKKLDEIVGARGKKRTNRKEQIDLLNELLDICKEKRIGYWNRNKNSICNCCRNFRL